MGTTNDKRSLRLLIVLLVALAALFSARAGVCETADSPLSGFGTATLDGVMSAGEWEKASRVEFQVTTPGGAKAPATLYVMNDWHNLYLALRVERPLWTNSYAFEVDSNNNGTMDQGDDAFVVNVYRSGATDLLDNFQTSLPPCPKGSLCGVADTDAGGTNDGAAVTKSDSKATVTEISKPLDSADNAHDFSVVPGQTLRLKISVRIFEGGMAETTYPGFGYLDVAIAAGPKEGMNTLTVEKLGDGEGSVMSAPPGIDCGQVCTWPYAPGTIVTLTATPEEDYEFAGWKGSRCTGTGPCALVMSGDVLVRAEFRRTKASPVVDQQQPVINVEAGVVLAIGSNSDQVLAQVVTAGITGELAEVRLAAACAEKIALTVRIEGVSGDRPNGVVLSSATFTDVGPYTSPPALKRLSLPEPVPLTAGQRFAIVLEATPDSMTSCSTYPGPAGNPYPGGDGFYGSRLDHPVQWVRMLYNAGTKAGVDLPFQTVVRPTVHLLTVTKAVNGAVKGGGMTCPGACSTLFYDGEEVTLNAIADTGFELSAWSGCDTVKANECMVTMAASRTVTATFTPAPVTTLTVRKAGTGAGTVTSAGGEIECGAVCRALVDICPGTHDGLNRVTLYAVPAPGSTFSGWSKGCINGVQDDFCILCAAEPTTVTAVFTRIPPRRVLVVEKEGSGKGTVHSVPSGIDCGTDCSSTYDLGTTVILSAVADEGYTFTGWSGGECFGTGICEVSLEGHKTVKARFECILPLPSKQEIFTYDAVMVPQMVCSAEALKPVGVGRAAEGKTWFSLAVETPAFDGKADYYLAIYAPDLDAQNVYLLRPDGTLGPVKAGLIPWIEGVEGSVRRMPWAEMGYIFGFSVPAGQYHAGLLVTPEGGTLTGPGYFWMTSFEVR